VAVIQYPRFPGLLTNFSLGPLSAILLITFLVESHEWKFVYLVWKAVGTRRSV